MSTVVCIACLMGSFYSALSPRVRVYVVRALANSVTRVWSASSIDGHKRAVDYVLFL